MLTNTKISFMTLLGVCSVLALLSGCAGKIPQSTMDNRSALSISVGLDSRASILNKESIKTDEVYFIKIDDENDSLKKQKVLSSNYNKEPFMAGFQMDNIDTFCFDLEPGAYAAVAARGTGANSQVEYYIYFPEDMVKKTIVNLKENSIRYMGEFVFEDVSFANQMKNADEIQLYYFMNGLIDGVPGKNKPQKITWYQNPQYHSPALEEVSNSKNDEIKFLKSNLGSFKNTEWHDNFRERLNELGD